MVTDQETVKVCPNCGRRCLLILALYSDRYYALCSGCTTETATADSGEEALELWNTGVFEQD